jgi:hypothetical protein
MKDGIDDGLAGSITQRLERGEQTNVTSGSEYLLTFLDAHSLQTVQS